MWYMVDRNLTEVLYMCLDVVSATSMESLIRVYCSEWESKIGKRGREKEREEGTKALVSFPDPPPPPHIKGKGSGDIQAVS